MGPVGARSPTPQAWTTYLLPGLANTLKAAALAMVIALPLGAIFGIARLSDHRWVRVPAGAVVEFFRAIPVLLLMIFANEFYVRLHGRQQRATGPCTRSSPAWCSTTPRSSPRSSGRASSSLPKGQTEAAKAVGLRKGQIDDEHPAAAGRHRDAAGASSASSSSS